MMRNSKSNVIALNMHSNYQRDTITKQNNKTKTVKQRRTVKNQLELNYEFLNDGTVAASATFNSKLFHNIYFTI